MLKYLARNGTESKIPYIESHSNPYTNVYFTLQCQHNLFFILQCNVVFISFGILSEIFDKSLFYIRRVELL